MLKVEPSPPPHLPSSTIPPHTTPRPILLLLPPNTVSSFATNIATKTFIGKLFFYICNKLIRMMPQTVARGLTRYYLKLLGLLASKKWYHSTDFQIRKLMLTFWIFARQIKTICGFLSSFRFIVWISLFCGFWFWKDLSILQ